MSAFKFDFHGPADHDPARRSPHYRQQYAHYVGIGHAPRDADAKAVSDVKAGRFKHARPVAPKQPTLFPGQNGGAR